MSFEDEPNLRRTLLAGKEEYIEHVCGSCLLENRKVEAKGHCKDCNQNICNDCIKSHKKLTGLMSHIIENEPKTSSNNKEEDAFSKLKTDVQRLEDSLNIYKTSTKNIQSDIIASYDNTVDQIKQWRGEVDKTLDKLENNMLEKASALKKEALGSLTETSLDCKKLILETKKLLKDLESNMKLDHNKQMISVKHTQETLSRMQIETEHIGEQCKPRKLAFYPHENILPLLPTLGLGTVYLSGEPASIQIKYARDTYVKSSTDAQDCLITSISFLPDGRLCLSDYKNKSIKLIDPMLMNITEQITFYSEPLESSMISKDEMAILLLNDKNLQVLSISPTLHASRSIRVRHFYNGIKYCEDKLLMSSGYKDDGCSWVDICDMTGNVIKRIETDVDGSKIFADPIKICPSPDRSIMYITDDEKHIVVCMNMDGAVINVYRHEKLKSFGGITVDKDGNVYTCSYSTHTIHQLTPTGKLVQLLLDQTLKFPYAIAYRSGQLFISSNSTSPELKNNIKIFRLTQKW